MRLVIAAVTTVVLAMVAGCGGGTSLEPGDLRRAEDAVRAELTSLNQPAFLEASYIGVPDGDDVCVEVDLGTFLGTEEAVQFQHRIVTMPDLSIGEALNGRCP